MLPLLLAIALGAATPEAARGTYRVEATVRTAGVPLLRTLELRGDVVLRPGDGPGAVRARLAARGHACELVGTIAENGALAFGRGQRCSIALDDPGVRGRVEATLRSGEGRVDDGRIALRLEVGLAGTVRIPTGGVPGLGGEAALPVDGDASVRAEGRRDNSRGAGP
ncbi:MAG TPA: hypothetical protein VIV57_02845 [Anaeromyxobacter sp.]